VKLAVRPPRDRGVAVTTFSVPGGVASLARGSAAFVLAAVVIAFSKYGEAMKQFMAESRVELRKIVWPNRQETGMTRWWYSSSSA